MFSRKKSEGSFSQKSLRRRFHHLLISRKRGDSLSKASIERPKRMWKTPSGPVITAVKKAAFFVVVSAVLIGLFYTVLFSDFFLITKITVEKNGNAVSGTLLAPFLDKLKNKNILFLNTDSFTKELEQTFQKQILLASTKKSYPNHLIVKVEEYPAVLNLEIITPDSTQKLVINQIGYTIFENTEQKELPVVRLNLPKPIPPKSIAIDPQKLDPIQKAFREFTELFGLKIVNAEWKKIERELHLNVVVPPSKNFSVWLDLTIPIDQQLSKLKRALTKLDIYHEPLEYIDLRIPGGESEKVIYKRRR